MKTTVKDLMEAGAHFGHSVSQRHPAFAPFVHSERQGTHIINTAFTLVQLEQAADFLRDTVANGGKVLFVGTKPQAGELLQQRAKDTGQYFVTFRWLGGFLTNFKTIRNSIKKMIDYEENEGRTDGLAITKKERLKLHVEYNKLVRVLAGVREMRKTPEAVVIVDVRQEAIAVHECNILGIPVVGICDSNSDPTAISYPIPGNDDSVRALEIYLDVLIDAIKEGTELSKNRLAAGPEAAVEETEFVLDKEEDLDEAALLARRKVYKVKKTITMDSKEEAAAAEAAASAEAPAEPAAEEKSEDVAEEKAEEAAEKPAKAKAAAKPKAPAKAKATKPKKEEKPAADETPEEPSAAE